jgi:hypothetical protein
MDFETKFLLKLLRKIHINLSNNFIFMQPYYLNKMKKISIQSLTLMIMYQSPKLFESLFKIHPGQYIIHIP